VNGYWLLQTVRLKQVYGITNPKFITCKFNLLVHFKMHFVDWLRVSKHCVFIFNLGIGKLSTGDGKHLADPEVLRRLTSSVSCALDEAAAALTRMRSENPRPQTETRYGRNWNLIL
jgi:hypothetical protein